MLFLVLVTESQCVVATRGCIVAVCGHDARLTAHCMLRDFSLITFLFVDLT